MKPARPFRVRAGDGATWCHLDNRPLYCPGDGHLWLHKQARLPLPLADYETGEAALLRGHPVLRPENPETFLEAYYGPGWRIPDPGYSNAAKGIPKSVTRGLSRICLSPRQQRDLAARYPGRVIPERWQDSLSAGALRNPCGVLSLRCGFAPARHIGLDRFTQAVIKALWRGFADPGLMRDLAVHDLFPGRPILQKLGPLCAPGLSCRSRRRWFQKAGAPTHRYPGWSGSECPPHGPRLPRPNRR